MSRAFRVKGLNALTRRGRRMHLSYATEKSYAGWAQSYIRALPKYPTAWPSKKKGRGFPHRPCAAGCGGGDAESGAECHCLSLQGRSRDADGDGGCAACEAPATVREALSIEETRALLSAMPEVADATACLVVRLLYGCGLRVSEPLELRIKDVDLAGARLTIRGNRAQASKTDKLTGSRPCSSATGSRAARLRWSRLVRLPSRH